MRRLILLAEMHRISTLLLEDRLDFLRQRFLPQLTKAVPAMVIPEMIKTEIEKEEGEDFANKLFSYIIFFDPDRTKKNAQWLLQQVITGALPVEDLETVAASIGKFLQVRSQLPADKRDLNRMKSVHDLYDAIEPFEDKQVASKRAEDRALAQKMRQQAEIVYDGADYRVLIPKTVEASCYFGINTKWCTAATSSYNMYNEYSKNGPLYIVLDKKANKRWQFSFENRQFMDERNAPINIDSFISEHPKVAEIFDKLDEGKERIGEIHGYVVLKSQDKIEFKTGTGLRGGGRHMGSINLKDNLITAINISRLIESGDFPFLNPNNVKTGEELAIIFNSADITMGSPEDPHLQNLDLFYDATKGWGRLHEVGHNKVSVDLVSKWVGFGPEDGCDEPRLALVVGGKEPLVHAKIDDEFLIVEKTSDPDEISAAVLALATEMGSKISRIGIVGDDETMQPSDLQADHIYALVDQRPELADVLSIVRLRGLKDPLVREAVVRHVEECDILGVPPQPPTWVGDALLVEKYKDVEEFVNENGNNDIKYMVKIITGQDRIEYNGIPVDDDNMEELLDSLPPEDRRRIGEYLQNQYPDEAEEIEDYDPSSSSSIVELQNVVEDDSLRSAFYSAITTGHEYGAEGEAYELAKAAIESSNAVFLVGGEWTHELEFGVPVGVLAPIADIVDEIKKDYNLTQWQYEGYWMATREEKLEASEPYYGYTDYDKSAAAERFSEDIEEFLPQEK